MCYFCQRNVKEMNWKNEKMLSRYLSASAKIKPKRKTNICSKHQRLLKNAVKKARTMAILPYTK